MSEIVTIYQPGELAYTRDSVGHIHVWDVRKDGTLTELGTTQPTEVTGR